MILSLFLLLSTILIMLLSVTGLEFSARYRDKAVLGQIYVGAIGSSGGGYRYILGPGGKLYILSESLGRQMFPEDEQCVLTRDGGYGDLDGTYAFVPSRKGPSGKEITDYQICKTCNQELATLKELGILSGMVKNVNSGAYDTTLYSATNVLEPRNNVTVWKLELASIQKNMDRENGLMEAYIDADDGKIYEFYARTPLTWKDIDPDRIAGDQTKHTRSKAPTPYETDNPLMGTASYFSKYIYSGVGDQKIVVTIDFYEGISELFLRTSK